jgi:hypothetical protein
LDLADRTERRLLHLPVFGAGYLAGGRQLLVATGPTAALQVIDARSGRVLAGVHPGGDPLGLGFGLTLATSPNGRYFAVGIATPQGDGEVQLWRARTWQRVRVVTDARAIGINTVAFSPDSSRLAVTENGGPGGVWLVSTNQQLISFSGATTGLYYPSFSAGSGDRVVTTDALGTVRVWRARGPEAFDAYDGSIRPRKSRRWRTRAPPSRRWERPAGATAPCTRGGSRAAGRSTPPSSPRARTRPRTTPRRETTPLR